MASGEPQILVILNRDQPQTMTRIDDLIAALSLDDLLLYT